VRFLVDAHPPAKLAEWLVGQGHEAEHVPDLDLGSAADQVIWSRALATSAIIISKDRDSADWALARRPAAQVAWLGFGNTGNAVVETAP
jgi:predicted nuclease of predicted toxin-antitoxin system